MLPVSRLTSSAEEPYMRLSWVSVAVILILVLLAAGIAYFYFAPGASNAFRETEVIEDPEVINEMVLGYVGPPFTNDYNVLRIPGWIDNNSESEIRAATIQIQLVDEDGNKQELVDYVVEELAPHSRKTFDINGGTIPPGRNATIQILELEVYK